jgi:hypothetical protein
MSLLLAQLTMMPSTGVSRFHPFSPIHNGHLLLPSRRVLMPHSATMLLSSACRCARWAACYRELRRIPPLRLYEKWFSGDDSLL